MSIPTKHALYTQHSRTWAQNRFVYPVVSRRSGGLSLGINLNPDKVCNFDCVYCSVDRKQPGTGREVDLNAIELELAGLLDAVSSGTFWNEPSFDTTPASLRRLNDVAFSGDGEPTSCARFPDACTLVASMLDRRALSTDTRIVLITNATLLHRPAVQEALRLLDGFNGEIWAKLDAGTQAYFQVVERSSVPLSRVLDNIRETGKGRPIVIQSLFMTLHDRGPDDAEIGAYVNRLRELVSGGCEIKRVQVYTVARQTAEPWVGALPDERIDDIARRVRETGLQVCTYYGPQ